MNETTSVIIPAFRNSESVARAVRSALDQAGVVEVIVVDDASGDETPEVARKAGDGDARLLILEQAVNQGPAAARNAAIRVATGDWIALLDADDFMSTGRVETLVSLANQRNWDIIADDLYRLPEGADTDARRRHWRDEPIGEIEIDLAFFVRQNDLAVSGPWRELGFLKPLMRRAFLAQHALIYDESMRLGEDFDLYARALLAGARFGLVDPAGYYAIDRPNSLSRQPSAQDLRQVWCASRNLLKHPGLTSEARDVIRAHALLSHKKWALVRQIEAVHDRDPLNFLAAFAAPPAVIGYLLDGLLKYLARRRRSSAE